jgi:hypothetical protein
LRNVVGCAGGDVAVQWLVGGAIAHAELLESV